MNIDPFAGDNVEGWESGSFPGVFTPSVSDIAGGTADARALGGGSLLATSGWSSESEILPHSGNWLAGNPSGTGWEIEFDSPVRVFGGYFGTNAVSDSTDAPDGSASFFDAADSLLGTAVITLGNGGTWAWNGWASDMGDIKKVQLSNGSEGGHHLMLDDLQTVTEPTLLTLMGVGPEGDNLGTVPEPTLLALMGLGLAGIGYRKRRKLVS